jgi:hypothetical protein
MWQLLESNPRPLGLQPGNLTTRPQRRNRTIANSFTSSITPCFCCVLYLLPQPHLTPPHPTEPHSAQICGSPCESKDNPCIFLSCFSFGFWACRCKSCALWSRVGRVHGGYLRRSSCVQCAGEKRRDALRRAEAVEGTSLSR